MADDFLPTPEDNSTFLGTLQQLGLGFIQGFTTVSAGEDPHGTIEGIARNIGSLMGFVGFIPIPGLAGKISKGRFSNATKWGLYVKSVPMFAADKVMGGVESLVSNKQVAASLDATRFFASGSMARDILKGGMHLGIASAASGAQPWQLHLEERGKALLGGVEAGVAFRALGNTFAKAGIADLGDEATNMVARTLTASLYQGLPSSIRNDPFPAQVYEYIMGGWFGYRETPVYHRRVLGAFSQYPSNDHRLLRPSDLPEWEKWDETTREYAQEQALERFGKWVELGLTDTGEAIAHSIHAAAQTDHKLYAEIFKMVETQELENTSSPDAKAVLEKSMDMAADVRQALNTIQSRPDVQSKLFQSYEEQQSFMKVVTDKIPGTSVSHLQAIGNAIEELKPGKTSVQYATEVATLIGDMTKEKGGWDRFRDFKQKLLVDYGLDIEKNDKLRGPVTQMWAEAAHSVQVKKLKINSDGNLAPVPDQEFDGRYTTERRVPSIIEKSAGINFYRLDNVEESDGKTWKLTPVHDADVNPARLISLGMDYVDEKGRHTPLAFMGGIKDNSQLVFSPLVVTDRGKGVYEYSVNGKKRSFHLRRALAGIKDGDKNGADVHVINRAKYLSDLGVTSNNMEVESRKYDMVTANNMALMDIQNGGIPFWEQWNDKGFITTAADFNKRMQIFYNGNPPVNVDEFRAVTPDGNLRARIIQSEENTGIFDPKIYGEKFIAKMEEMKDDGVIAVLPELMPSFRRAYGMPDDVSGLKPMVVFADELGAFAGKGLIHEATPELAQSMRESGDQIRFYKTAAKQYGRRVVGKETYKDGKFGADSPQYKIPVTAFRMNYGASENGEVKDVRAVKQLTSNLPRFLTDMWMLEKVNPIHKGDREQNRIVETFEKMSPEKQKEMVEQFDPEKTGTYHLLQLLAGRYRRNLPLFEKAAKYVLRFHELDNTKEEDLLDEQNAATIFEFGQMRSSAERVLATNIWTPEILESKMVKPLFHTMIRNTIVNRLVKPMMEGSWKSKMYHVNSEVLQKYGLKAGEYMLPESMRGKVNIKVGDEHFIIRVPADSPAGIRSLKFKGFIPTVGNGIYLHPEDMQALGGADLDGDMAFIYTKLSSPKFDAKVREYLNSRKDMWTGDGKLPKKLSEASDEAFRSGNPVPETLKHPASVIDPYMRLRINRWAYFGNTMLGRGLSHIARLQELQEAFGGTSRTFEIKHPYHLIRAVAEGKIPVSDPELKKRAANYISTKFRDNDYWEAGRSLAKEMGLSDIKSMTVSFNADKAPLEKMKYDLINTAADAAKGHELRPWQESKHDVTKSIINEIQLNRSDGTSFRVNDTAILGAIPEMKELKLLTQYINGRNYNTGRKYALFDVLDGLTERDLRKPFVTRPYLPIFRIARMLGETANTLSPEDISITHTLGVGWDKMPALFERLYKDKAVIRKAYLTLRTATLTDTGGWESALKQSGKTLRGMDYVNELRMQDLMDNVSMIAAMQEGDKLWQAMEVKGVDYTTFINQLHEIGANIARLKTMKALAGASVQDIAQMRKDARKSGMSPADAADTYRRHTPEYVYTRALEYRGSLPEEYRRFFDVYSAGSLVRQPEALINAEGELVGGARKLRQLEAEGKKNTPEYAELLKQYLATNQSNFAYAIDLIDPMVIKNTMELVRGVATISASSNPEKMDDTMKELFKLVRRSEARPTATQLSGAEQAVPGNPFLAKEGDGPGGATPQTLQKISEQFFSRMKSLGNRTITDKWLQEKSDALRQIFHYRPEVARNFANLFEGLTGHSPTVALKADLEKFIDAFYYKGKPEWELTLEERFSALKKKHFFYTPQGVAESLGSGWKSMWNSERPVITEEGPVMHRPVLILSSHMDRITNTLTTLHALKNAALERALGVVTDHMAPVRETPEGERLLQLGTMMDEAEVGLLQENSTEESRAFYADRAERAQREFDKEYDSGKKKLRIGGHEVTAREQLEKIRKSRIAIAEYFYNFITGANLKKSPLVFFDEKKGYLDLEGSVNKLLRMIEHEKELPEISMDGYLRIRHALLLGEEKVKTATGYRKLRDIPRDDKYYRQYVAELNDRIPFQKSPVMPPSMYSPRNGHPIKVLEDLWKRQQDELIKNGVGQAEVIRRMQTERTRATIANSIDGGVSQEGIDVISGLSSWYGLPSFLKQREVMPLPGWDETSKAWQTYAKQVTNAYYNGLMFALTESRVRDFEKRYAGNENTRPWANFMRMFIQRNLGQPSTFPEQWLSDERFPLRRSPGYWLTDQHILDIAERWDKTLNLEQYISKLEKESAKGDAASQKYIRELAAKYRDAEYRRNRILKRIATISNMEAKWTMASLLFHPKTAVANLTGGITHDAIDVGFSYMKKARDINFWRDVVHMKDEHGQPVRDMADVWRMANLHGAGESYINDLLQSQDVGTQKKLGDLWADIKKARAANPNISDSELIPDLLRKHDIAKSIWDSSGFFMRKTEYINRTTSWLAHYAKHYDTLSANNFTFPDWDDPWLIQLANRGVQGTQFLYNNASRALFASTDLGKMLVRLQQFTIQSLRMRSGIVEAAHQSGYKNGSDEMKRLERLMVSDMMMLGLATLFPASLFNANLGQPWQWLTDLSDFFFGSDEEKERAFYGTLPYPANILQPLSPPFTRYVTPVFNSILSDDWGKLFDRQIWSWFPFGRFAYDAHKVYENPAILVERSTGFPLHSLSSKSKQAENRQQLVSGILSGLLP